MFASLTHAWDSEDSALHIGRKSTNQHDGNAARCRFWAAIVLPIPIR
jgi:hypothetical protein